MNVVLETLDTREEILDSVIAKIKRSRKKCPMDESGYVRIRKDGCSIIC